MKKLFVFLTLILVIFFSYYYFQGKKLNLNKNLKENLKNLQENKKGSISTSLPDNNLSEESFYLEIISPKDKEIVRGNNLTVRGKTAPYAQVFINDKETTADKEGNFFLNYSLDEGENEILVVANDSIGNYAEKILTVELQTQK